MNNIKSITLSLTSGLLQLACAALMLYKEWGGFSDELGLWLLIRPYFMGVLVLTTFAGAISVLLAVFFLGVKWERERSGARESVMTHFGKQPVDVAVYAGVRHLLEFFGFRLRSLRMVLVEVLALDVEKALIPAPQPKRTRRIPGLDIGFGAAVFIVFVILCPDGWPKVPVPHVEEPVSTKLVRARLQMYTMTENGYRSGKTATDKELLTVARLALDEYEAAATMRIPEAAEPAEEGLRVANHITQILRQRAGFPPLPQPGTEDFNPKDEPDQINRY